MNELVFSVSVFPEGRLFFGDQVVCFQVPHQSFVDHSFKSLAKAAEQADWSVACFPFWVFPLFEDGDDGSFFPRCREDASCPRLVEEFKQLQFCSFPEMSDHFVGDSVFAGGLSISESFDRILEFPKGKVRRHRLRDGGLLALQAPEPPCNFFSSFG